MHAEPDDVSGGRRHAVVPHPSVLEARAELRFGPWDALVVFVAGFVASVLLSSLVFALTAESGDTFDDAHWTVGLAGVVGQFGGWAAGLYLDSRMRGTGSLRHDYGLGLSWRDWWAVPLGVGLQVGLGLLLYPLSQLVDDRQDVVEALEDATGGELAVLAVTALVLAPVLEELLFRGLLLRGVLCRRSVTTAIAVSALAFAAVHLLDFSLGTLVVSPAFVVLGAVSARFAVQTGSLSRSILLHVGFNTLPVLAALLS